MKSLIATSQGKISILDTNPKASPDEPTVFFIHGHCTNKTFFSEQFQSPLFDKYRLIAIDLPGYGESQSPKDPQKIYSFPGYAQVLAEVIQQLDLKNYVFLGWSLGGHVGLEAIALVNHLKGLIISGTPPIEISENGFTQGFKALNPAVANCFGKGNLTRKEAELLATISGYDHTPEKEFLVEAILNTDEGAKTIYPASIANGVGKNELEIIRDCSLPIAVIGGENDSAVNYDYIKKISFKNLWRKQVFLIPEAGHAVFLEKPSQFNHLVKEYLEEVFKSEGNKND